MSREWIPHNRFVNRPEYEEAVLRVLRSGYVESGEECRLFEMELARRFGAPWQDAFLVRSGSEALRYALYCMSEYWGFPNGSDLITSIPTYACMSIYNQVRGYAHAIRDIELASLGSEASDGVVVHTYGQWAPRAFGCRVEDFTHAIGGGSAGSNGYVSLASFGATKPLGIGCGGVVFAHRYFVNRWRANRHYEEPILGHRSNLNLSDINWAIGRARLARLDEDNAWRMKTYHRYLAACRTKGQETWTGPEPLVAYRFVLKVEDWKAARDRFGASGIDTINPLEPRELIHRVLGLPKSNYPNAEKVAATSLSLPIWPGMTDEMVERVAEAI